MEPIGSTPGEFDALIRAEIEKWAKVVEGFRREGGLTPSARTGSSHDTAT